MPPDLLPVAMLDWLRIGFQTLGGFVAGFGILIISVAFDIMIGRRRALEWGSAVALLVAFGRSIASNIILRSDYLWFVGVLFALRARSVVVRMEAHGSAGEAHA